MVRRVEDAAITRSGTGPGPLADAGDRRAIATTLAGFLAAAATFEIVFALVDTDGVVAVTLHSVGGYLLSGTVGAGAAVVLGLRPRSFAGGGGGGGAEEGGVGGAEESGVDSAEEGGVDGAEVGGVSAAAGDEDGSASGGTGPE